jgi:hypothetical protein
MTIERKLEQGCAESWLVFDGGAAALALLDPKALALQDPEVFMGDCFENALFEI